ncbi:ATPase AAA [Devosia limi DSM 17137]|uniref:ATPase AAA n=1 Tax=Devosia limi DSM 17137 TaxID=1121477 RepID=A0A0F5L6V4_9HYPH|nr:ATPase AAA [Devosia limi]KKB77362.1 ATPase AAA [Devosia limi DSM 17137]SHE67556.1 Adenylate kinase [Devosia limi DSM 17137]
MHDLPLETLGRRICILGPTNAGKSTLCAAIARKLGVPAVHLDQFRHLPNTDWEPRPDAEFHALHDAAILAPEWVMDGNYSALLPQRFARATGIIALDGHYLARFGRYLRRTLFQPDRAGGLEGKRDSIKLEMIHWVWKTRNSFGRYHARACSTGLPIVTCRSLADLRSLGRAWELD